MGLRYRKSINLGGGVRLNLSKSGLGLSLGTRGMRYSVNTRGQVNRTIGVPGTGAFWRSTTRVGSAADGDAAVATPPARPAPLSAGLFAPKGLKALYRAINLSDEPGMTPRQVADAFAAVANSYPTYAFDADVLAGLHTWQSAPDLALPALGRALASGRQINQGVFLPRLAHVTLPVTVSDVPMELSLSRDTLAVLVCALHEARGELDDADRAAAQAPDSRIAVAMRTDIAKLQHRYDDVLRLTDGVTNTDDVTAIMLLNRAEALAEQKRLDAALQVVKEILHYPSRATIIQHHARFIRANVLSEQGQTAKARGEAERILADDSSYPGLAELLDALKA